MVVGVPLSREFVGLCGAKVGKGMEEVLFRDAGNPVEAVA
jgi:hypothetical protein